MALEDLPVEILLRICEYLDSQDKAHLNAFSLASRTCDACAASVLFRNIHIRLPYQPHPKFLPKLSDAVSVWPALLQRRSAHKHVRCLKLIEVEGYPCQPSHLDLLEYDDQFADPTNLVMNDPATLSHNQDIPVSDEDEWLTLSGLIRQLPTLKDLHFNLSRRMPGCLLDTLSQYQPHCNLHLGAFWFPNFLRYGSQALDQLPLLLFPRLSSINTRSCGYCKDGQEDYAHEAVMALTNGLNPALKHVSLNAYGGHLGGEIDFAVRSHHPRRPWKGFDIPESLKSGTRPALKSLELGGKGTVYLDLLQACFRSCDISKLQNLKLRIPYTHPGLGWLTTNVDFPSLQSLILGTNDDRCFVGLETASGVDDAASFIRTLPSLTAIWYVAEINQDIFEATLSNHGQSLKRLWFPPPRDCAERPVEAGTIPDFFFDRLNIAELQQHCPGLEDLSLPVRRSRTMEEVEAYNALGQFLNLQTLAISLDCNPLSQSTAQAGELGPSEPSFDDYDNEEFRDLVRYTHGYRPRKGHARLALMNAAFDEPLARSIFDTISKAKPAGALSLERLELRPVKGRQPYQEIEFMILHISQWWLLERNPRDDMRNQVLAKRIRSWGDNTKLDAILAGERMRLEADRIFHKIWPTTADWRSFPLPS